MKSLFFSLPASLLTGILLLLLLFACKKDPYEIGIDLLPPSDTLHLMSTDTCTVKAFSVRQDSVRTNNPGTLMLGSIADPIFGKTTCSFYSQALLSTEGADFGTLPVLDSLVLMLFYSGYHGDTTTEQNVKVYEMSDDICADSLYYSNQQVRIYSTVLANQNFKPHPNDSVTVSGKKMKAHLRINLNKLTNCLGNKILSAPSSALASNTAFIKYLKGLYVATTPVNSRGATLNFETSTSLSKLVVYFHDGTDPSNDSLDFEMPLSSSAARFIHIDHNGYLDASQELKRQILNHDSAQGANQLFLQGLGGVKIKVKFPFMSKFGNGKVVAINDAILRFYNPEADTSYSPPATLYLMRQDSIGRVGYVIDENEGSSYFGGTYDQTTRSYYFRITRHMQKMMMNYYSNHFDLYLMVTNPLSNSLVPGRVILNGTNPLLPGALTNRFQLKVTYTILN
ncbi:MAG: DUF4270 domain-containing protein [Bacteroidales bacterium]|nr:DUF4270 domain-containing protein [Bacteroidales bacterium]